LLLNNTWFYPNPVRFLIRSKVPTEAGNKTIQDPEFIKKLEDYMNKVKPEAATSCHKVAIDQLPS
jgi:hypothetical protein